MNNPHLEGLIRKWRDAGARAANGPMYDGASEYAVAGTYIACADELQAAIAALPGGGVDEETRLNVELRRLLKDRPLYLMGREHVNEQTKPLAEISFGMASSIGVLFCMKDTEAPIPKDTLPTPPPPRGRPQWQGR